MRKVFKPIFKIVIFFINIALGIGATVYLVLKFKARRKTKTAQLKLIEDKEDNPKLTDVIAQNKRTEEVYKLIKELKEVDMTVLLAKVKGVTERTLRRDLAKLQTMKLIKKSGSTKSAKYSLAK
jgi:predicted HTH transcriptional regulator